MADLQAPARVGVAGATGYAGAELVALLREHPRVSLEQVSSRSQAGRSHREVCLGSGCDLELRDEPNARELDVVISALSPLEAAHLAPAWLDQGALVIDVSPDFRLRDPTLYRTWYGTDHPAPELLAKALLALPELRPGTGEERLIALPGCFSTAAILACGPAVCSGLVGDGVVVDGKTGVSGAGRSAGGAYLFSELDETVLAYGVSGHRHRPEMTQALSELRGTGVEVTFVPHLVPMSRGCSVSCYMQLAPGADLGQLLARYREAYQGSPFVHLLDRPPPSKLASRTNHTFIHLAVQGRLLVVEAALDNLGRGAAWQAVQVLNWRLGLEPATGIGRSPQWP